MIGEVVGSYQIERELGVGGMGTVYLAHHKLLDKWAAVKMLRPQWSEDQEAVDRFFTEATATTAVRHGGIVDVYDFGHHPNGSAFLVMELLEGETLGERIRRCDRIPENAALAFGWQAARALAAAHSADIVHRDLKPDNIFLTDDAAAVGGVRVKLLDFGIAKLTKPGAKSHTSPGELVGTPLFMSPEHCLAKKLDGRADVYSLACVLFYAIGGRPPFYSEDHGELLRAHAAAAPPHLSEVWPQVRPETSDLLYRCMNKKPAKRPNATEFAEALRALADAPADVTVPPKDIVSSSRPALANAPARALSASDGSQNANPPTSFHQARPGSISEAADRRGVSLFWVAVAALVLVGGGIGIAFSVIDRGSAEATTKTEPTQLGATLTTATPETVGQGGESQLLSSKVRALAEARAAAEAEARAAAAAEAEEKAALAEAKAEAIAKAAKGAVKNSNSRKGPSKNGSGSRGSANSTSGSGSSESTKPNTGDVKPSSTDSTSENKTEPKKTKEWGTLKD